MGSLLQYEGGCDPPSRLLRRGSGLQGSCLGGVAGFPVSDHAGLEVMFNLTTGDRPPTSVHCPGWTWGCIQPYSVLA
jgi:hypothetical protein